MVQKENRSLLVQQTVIVSHLFIEHAIAMTLDPFQLHANQLILISNQIRYFLQGMRHISRCEQHTQIIWAPNPIFL